MEEIKETEKKDNIKEVIEKAAPYIKILIANWKKLLIINGTVAVLSAAVLLIFVKNYYDSTITVLPDYGSTSSMLGNLGGLAAIAGINFGETTPTEVYNNLLHSESVLIPVIYAKYTVSGFETPLNLIEYYDIDLKTADEEDPVHIKERDKLLQMLKIFNRDILKSSVDRLTTIMTATISTDDPSLSADIANNLMASLDDYVRTKRKSNAKEQSIYIKERVAQVKDSLTFLENKLRDFREQNRIIAQSPQLLLEQGRLTRALEIQQTIFIELTKQLELIKLEEIKDAPIINIREEAGIPIIKAGPKRSIFLILIMMISIVITCVFILYKEKFQDYKSFVTHSLK